MSMPTPSPPAAPPIAGSRPTSHPTGGSAGSGSATNAAGKPPSAQTVRTAASAASPAPPGLTSRGSSRPTPSPASSPTTTAPTAPTVLQPPDDAARPLTSGSMGASSIATQEPLLPNPLAGMPYGVAVPPVDFAALTAAERQLYLQAATAAIPHVERQLQAHTSELRARAKEAEHAAAEVEARTGQAAAEFCSTRAGLDDEVSGLRTRRDGLQATAAAARKEAAAQLRAQRAENEQALDGLRAEVAALQDRAAEAKAWEETREPSLRELAKLEAELTEWKGKHERERGSIMEEHEEAKRAIRDRFVRKLRRRRDRITAAAAAGQSAEGALGTMSSSAAVATVVSSTLQQQDPVAVFLSKLGLDVGSDAGAVLATANIAGQSTPGSAGHAALRNERLARTNAAEKASVAARGATNAELERELRQKRRALQELQADNARLLVRNAATLRTKAVLAEKHSAVAADVAAARRQQELEKRDRDAALRHTTELQGGIVAALQADLDARLTELLDVQRHIRDARRLAHHKENERNRVIRFLTAVGLDAAAAVAAHRQGKVQVPGAATPTPRRTSLLPLIPSARPAVDPSAEVAPAPSEPGMQRRLSSCSLPEISPRPPGRRASDAPLDGSSIRRAPTPPELPATARDRTSTPPMPSAPRPGVTVTPRQCSTMSTALLAVAPGAVTARPRPPPRAHKSTKLTPRKAPTTATSGDGTVARSSDATPAQAVDAAALESVGRELRALIAASPVVLPHPRPTASPTAPQGQELVEERSTAPSEAPPLPTAPYGAGKVEDLHEAQAALLSVEPLMAPALALGSTFGTQGTVAAAVMAGSTTGAPDKASDDGAPLLCAPSAPVAPLSPGALMASEKRVVHRGAGGAWQRGPQDAVQRLGDPRDIVRVMLDAVVPPEAAPSFGQGAHEDQEQDLTMVRRPDDTPPQALMA